LGLFDWLGPWRRFKRVAAVRKQIEKGKMKREGQNKRKKEREREKIKKGRGG
jgi:hypothetical protein